MSYIKNSLENTMESLAEETGYDPAFLWDMYAECDDWDHFVSVTKEHDW